MNPDSPKTPREEMETWLTSFLLGELSAGEAAAVRELIKHDPELAKLHDELKSTIQLVQEATVRTTEPTPAVQDQPKLAAERREKLLAQFKTVALPEVGPAKRRKTELLVGIAAVVTIIGLLAAIVTPVSRSFRLASNIDVLEYREAALEPANADIPKRIQVSGQPNYSGVALGGQEAGTVVIYDGAGDKSGGNLSYYSLSGPSDSAKQPVGLTSVPTKPSTPIVLPTLSDDSPSQTALAANRAYSYGTAQVPEQRVTQWSDSLRTPSPSLSESALQAVPASGGQVAAEPQWIGGLEKVDQPHSASSSFVYAAGAGGVATPLPSRSLRTPQSAPLIDPSTGLPATEPAPVVDPTTGLPVAASALAGDAVTESRSKEVWHQDAETLGTSFRRRYAATADPLAIPSVPVAGGGGGGGGGGAGPAQPNLTPPAEGSVNGITTLSDAAGVRLQGVNEGKSVSIGGAVQARGATVNGADRFGLSPSSTANSQLAASGADGWSVDKLREALKNGSTVEGVGESDVAQLLAIKPPQVNIHAKFTELTTNSIHSLGFEVAGSELSLGRTFTTNSTDANGLWGDNSQQNKQQNVRLAGSTAARPGKAARPASVTPLLSAESESLERSKERGRLEQLKDLTETDSKRTLSELSDGSGLRETYLGLKVAEEKLATLQKDSAVSAIDLEQAQKQVANLKKKADDQSGRVLARLENRAGVEEVRKADKLESLQIEAVPYDGLPLGEVARDLKELSRKADPEKRGINFIVNPNNPNSPNQPLFVDPVTGLPAVPPAGVTDVAAISVKINKPLANANLRDVLDEVVRSADRPIKYSIEDYGIVFSMADVQDQPIIRKPSTNAPIPQPEVQTSENNFSTFSLNVSDVSFKLAAASLEKGQMPDVASVRSEEFINAFDYRDPEPALGAPIAFAWERARYPFAHNRDLLRFSLKTAAAGRQAGRSLNLVLLLDNSGSMERADRVRIIREALRVLAGQLQPQDKLSVITFARTPRLVADGIAGDRAAEVTEAVSGLTPEGGTNLEEAMNLGYQTAARHYVIGGINRVVVLTDGAANLGDVEPESLKQKVEDARKQGIALDAFGVGWEGYNDDLLEVLSRNGDGRYGFLNSPDKAAKDFVGQLAGALKVAASDVKVQVEFNPHRVTSYRQIGYAKHQLTKEQFRDNTVDAAEIAAQEAGNALYTVEVNPAGAGPLCTVRVRYKIPGTTNYREQAWDVPYTGNALSLEQSSPAMRLAGSASAFSEWLVASPFAGEVSPDAVLNVLRGVPEVFGADSRPKTLEWMIRQAKSIEGK